VGTAKFERLQPSGKKDNKKQAMGGGENIKHWGKNEGNVQLVIQVRTVTRKSLAGGKQGHLSGHFVSIMVGQKRGKRDRVARVGKRVKPKIRNTTMKKTFSSEPDKLN